MLNIVSLKFGFEKMAMLFLKNLNKIEFNIERLVEEDLFKLYGFEAEP